MKTINKQHLRFLLVAAACGGSAGSALVAQDASTEAADGPDIVARSPFIPPGFTPPQAGKASAGKAAAGGYEFRGVYQLGDEYRFLVSPPRSRNGNWVQVGKSYEDYEVRRYDAASETLTLFFNNSETQLTLAELESNPTPTPVSGQVQTPATPGAAPNAAPQPVRRTIRPATRSGESSSSPPPPAWLEKLREEAAARRAQAAQSRFGAAGASGSGVNATGTPGGPGDSPIPAPPDMPPPTPPPNLSEIDIPPPPTTLPPPPPPEVMKQIQQSMSYSPVPPNG